MYTLLVVMKSGGTATRSAVRQNQTNLLWNWLHSSRGCSGSQEDVATERMTWWRTLGSSRSHGEKEEINERSYGRMRTTRRQTGASHAVTTRVTHDAKCDARASIQHASHAALSFCRWSQRHERARRARTRTTESGSSYR